MPETPNAPDLRATYDTHPLTFAEYDRFCAHMPYRSRESHWRRLSEQGAGELAYLVAWRLGGAEGHTGAGRRSEPRAVGFVMLYWSVPPGHPIAGRLDCPWIVDLFVAPDARSQGAASALLGACERLARTDGAHAVALGVTLSNTTARALYARLGYEDAGLGARRMTGSFEDEEGVTHVWEDDVTYLVKRLPETADAAPAEAGEQGGRA